MSWDKNKNPSTLMLYWQAVIRPHWKEAGVIVSLMLLSAALDMMAVGLTVPLLDVLVNPSLMEKSRILSFLASGLKRMGLPAQPSTVIFTLLFLATGLFIFRSVFYLLHKYWTTMIAHKMRREVRELIFQKILLARYEEITKLARGTVINHIHSASESLYLAIISLGHLFTGIFNSLLMIALMLVLSWWATLIIAAMAVGGIVFWRRLTERQAEALGKWIFELGGVESKLETDAIDGLKVVKSHGLESRMVTKVGRLLKQEMEPVGRLVLLRQGPALINEMIASLIILAFGAVCFLIPQLGIRFSTLVGFLLAVKRIAPALGDASAYNVELNKIRRGVEMAEEFLKHLPQERMGGKGVGRVQALQLEDLSFAYPSRPGHKVLEGVSIAMKRGTVTALVGPTGSGKSTIAHLLVGLYEPNQGAIRINGSDLKECDLVQWRKQIGYVCQDVFLFNATVRENIALGDDLPLSSIEWASQKAQLHDFVSTLPNGYETLVGDRGLRLSGGQCQRLAIARAILRNPEVLIFDEATSALDNLTERAVYSAINALREKAVVIVIAHRLSTVKDADQIVVLREGRVAEEGNHSTLMNQQGVYSGLYHEVEDVPSGRQTRSC